MKYEMFELMTDFLKLLSAIFFALFVIMVAPVFAETPPEQQTAKPATTDKAKTMAEKDKETMAKAKALDEKLKVNTEKPKPAEEIPKDKPAEKVEEKKPAEHGVADKAKAEEKKPAEKADEHGAADKAKAEEKKPTEKPDEHGAADKAKVEEKKPTEKPDEHGAADKAKVEEKKPTEKPAEHGVADKAKAEEKKPAEKADEHGAADKAKAEEKKPAEKVESAEHKLPEKEVTVPKVSETKTLEIQTGAQKTEEEHKPAIAAAVTGEHKAKAVKKPVKAKKSVVKKRAVKKHVVKKSAKPKAAHKPKQAVVAKSESAVHESPRTPAPKPKIVVPAPKPIPSMSGADAETLTPVATEPTPMMEAGVTTSPLPYAVRKVSVLFESTPSSCDIEIDGVYVGSTPVQLSLKDGTHLVKMSRPGYITWEKTVRAYNGLYISPTLVSENTTKRELTESVKTK